MAEKKKPQNKSEKKKVETKSIDWASMPDMVEVMINGKKVSTAKANAKVLVDVKRATLV